MSGYRGETVSCWLNKACREKVTGFSAGSQ